MKQKNEIGDNRSTANRVSSENGLPLYVVWCAAIAVSLAVVCFLLSPAE
jgi:hypothetical protein